MTYPDERLVPILMTALAAGLALVPIALSAGEPGSEIQAPMAMVIMFGLLSSTALNMIVSSPSVKNGSRAKINRIAAPSPSNPSDAGSGSHGRDTNCPAYERLAEVAPVVGGAGELVVDAGIEFGRGGIWLVKAADDNI